MKKIISIFLSFSLVFLVSFSQAADAVGTSNAASSRPKLTSFPRIGVDSLNKANFRVNGAAKAISASSLTSTDSSIKLNFNPIDTVMDPSRPIVYMTDGDTNKVHAVNYLTGEIKSIQFSLQPERIIFANNEVYVTLLKMSHTYYTTQPLVGAIAVIDASTFTKKIQFDINTDPYDIAVDSQYIYISPGSNQWEPMRVYSRTTGAEIANARVRDMYHQTFIHLHPLFSKIYAITTAVSPRDIETYVFNEGTLTTAYDSPYHGDYNMATNLRISPDGKYIFNGSGNIFKCSNAKEYDMTYFNKLDSGFTDIAFDLDSNKIYTGLQGGNIGVYDYATLTKIGTLSSNGIVHSLYFQDGKLIATVKNPQNLFEVRNIDVNSTPNPQVGIEVLGTYPDGGSTGMPVKGGIVVKLSENVRIDTTKSNSFTLTTAGNSNNYITSADVIDNYLILFYNNLGYNKQYTLTVKAGSVADYSGGYLLNDYTMGFTTGAEFNRLAGIDRYETSSAISKMGWEQSNYVVLATGETFPDALCAGPLAAAYTAPILLTEQAALSPKTDAEISRLKPKEIFIIGGTGAVSSSTESYLKSKGIKVTRIAGLNRYDTSLQIAKYLGDVNEVFIATGDNFPDTLSIASFAAYNQIPILLTPQNSLPTDTNNYIRSNNITKSYVIGGSGVVSDSVLNSLPFGERIAGKNRYETNLEALSRLQFDFTSTFIATGSNFPDALSGSALAGIMSSPIILVDSDMPADVISVLRDNRDIMRMKYILGGTGVVPEDIITKIYRQ